MHSMEFILVFFFCSVQFGRVTHMYVPELPYTAEATPSLLSLPSAHRFVAHVELHRWSLKFRGVSCASLGDWSTMLLTP